MPTSLDTFDSDFLIFLKKAMPATSLHVGPGLGRYGYHMRDHLPSCVRDAVEVDLSYIEKYKLNSLYRTVYNEDIKNFLLKNSTMRYDLVLFNDILEHLFRSDAIDVLDFCLYRSKFVVVQWPNDLLQDNWEGHESEVHRSNFKLKDLVDHNFNVMFYKKKYFIDDQFNFSMNFCVLKGYKHNTEILL